MVCAKNSRIEKPAHFTLLLLAALLVSTFAVGCTSEEEKAKKAITKAVEQCRSAEVDGQFYKVELFDGEGQEILHSVCDKELTNFEMTSDVSADGYTGPVRWGVRVDKETGLWTLYGAEWSSLQRARGAISENDPSEESLQYAEVHFKKAQEEMPESSWIRLRRLENLLNLRAKTRKKDTPNPVSIGEEAQAHFDETVSWAKEQDDLDTQVEAQYLVVNHIRDYRDRIEMILSSDGSSDEWLIKAAETAEKDGDHEKAEEYRQELEEARQKREEDREIFTERLEKTNTYLCEQAGKLSPAGIDNSALQGQVVALKDSLDCMAQNAADAKMADSE